MMHSNLLEVNNLKKWFPIERGFLRKKIGEVRAVDGISLSVKEKETVGLVGESGCGKTTTGYMILRLMEPTDGEIIFDGVNILRLSSKEFHPYRKEIQFVFQDPYSSLNPRMNIFSILSEPLKIHFKLSKSERQERVWEAMRLVGLDPKTERRYPHEFSGGQRQRIGIARSLMVNPRLIVLDEPVSALDVSIQSQIINLLVELQDKLDLSYIFIAHNLALVRYICHRVCVMYLGKIVEMAETEDLFTSPQHPYTRSLLNSVPIPDPTIRPKRSSLIGEVPSPINPPPGCKFHPRCQESFHHCSSEEPELAETGEGHFVACHKVKR